MVTLWLIGTWVAMETCLKPKSIWREGFQQRGRVVRTICGNATLPMTVLFPSEGLLWDGRGSSPGPSSELVSSVPTEGLRSKTFLPFLW